MNRAATKHIIHYQFSILNSPLLSKHFPDNPIPEKTNNYYPHHGANDSNALDEFHTVSIEFVLYFVIYLLLLVLAACSVFFEIFAHCSRVVLRDEITRLEIMRVEFTSISLGI
jgi:hypothetical protein